MITSHGIWTQMLGDDDFLMECILIMYNLQTSSERITKSTHHTNGVGFNKADAPFLTELSKKIKSMKEGPAKWLLVSSDDLEIAREKMQKYSRQLANILNIGDD